MHFILQKKSLEFVGFGFFLIKALQLCRAQHFTSDFCEKHQVQKVQFLALPVLWKHINFTNCPNRVIWNWAPVCLNISRVSWIAVTLGLAVSLHQNYEGDHGWVFTDNTFLKPNNIA